MNIHADYHIHYYVDVCADQSMTLPNIDDAVFEMGLSEIAVLGHCSARHPGGGPAWKEWDYWHTLVRSRLDTYLYDIHHFESKHGIRIYSGIETELLDDDGNLATLPDVLENIDMAAVSLHYMPELKKLNLSAFPSGPKDDPEYQALFAEWKRSLGDLTSERVIEGVANAYIAAIVNHPKMRSLAHMDDLSCLEYYGVDVRALPPETLTEILEPLMKTAAQHEVLWEITNTCREHPLFARANELGVKFSPTGDAHLIKGGWGPLARRDGAAAFIEKNALNVGRLVLR